MKSNQTGPNDWGKISSHCRLFFHKVYMNILAFATIGLIMPRASWRRAIVANALRFVVAFTAVENEKMELSVIGDQKRPKTLLTSF